MTSPKTFKNAQKHGQMLFEFGGRFLAPRSVVQGIFHRGLAAGVGPIGGGGGFASQLCRGLGLHIQHALLPLTEVRRILRATPPAAGPHSRGVGCGVLAVLCWLGWLAGLGWAGDAGKDELGRLARSGWLGLPSYFLLFVWLLFLCFFF